MTIRTILVSSAPTWMMTVGSEIQVCALRHLALKVRFTKVLQTRYSGQGTYSGSMPLVPTGVHGVRRADTCHGPSLQFSSKIWDGHHSHQRGISVDRNNVVYRATNKATDSALPRAKQSLICTRDLAHLTPRSMHESETSEHTICL